MKAAKLILLVCLLSACAGNPMRAPLSAASESELRDSLSLLEARVSHEQFERTREAIGILMLTRLEYPQRQRFLQEVIDGQSPDALIAAARPAAVHYRIEQD